MSILAVTTGEIVNVDAEPERKLAAAVVKAAVYDVVHGSVKERGIALNFLLSDRAEFWYELIATDPDMVREKVWDALTSGLNAA